MTKKFSPYKFLTHAAIHCRFGSDTTDREPTQADLQAEKILLACRMKLSGSHIHAGFGCPICGWDKTCLLCSQLMQGTTEVPNV